MSKSPHTVSLGTNFFYSNHFLSCRTHVSEVMERNSRLFRKRVVLSFSSFLEGFSFQITVIAILPVKRWKTHKQTNELSHFLTELDVINTLNLFQMNYVIKETLTFSYVEKIWHLPMPFYRIYPTLTSWAWTKRNLGTFSLPRMTR